MENIYVLRTLQGNIKIIESFNLEWLSGFAPVKLLYWAITMFCVIVAWVFFRDFGLELCCVTWV